MKLQLQSFKDENAPLCVALYCCTVLQDKKCLLFVFVFYVLFVQKYYKAVRVQHYITVVFVGYLG